jgi:hypothetical protein
LFTDVRYETKSGSGWKRTFAPLRVGVAVKLLQRIVRVNSKYGYESDLAQELTLAQIHTHAHMVPENFR